MSTSIPVTLLLFSTLNKKNELRILTSEELNEYPIYMNIFDGSISKMQPENNLDNFMIIERFFGVVDKNLNREEMIILEKKNHSLMKKEILIIIHCLILIHQLNLQLFQKKQLMNFRRKKLKQIQITISLMKKD